MVGLDLSTSANSVVIWLIVQCYYVVDLILDSVWIILTLYVKFCAFRIIVLTEN